MADTKGSALPTFTPVLTDVVVGVDDPGGTPASGKVTFSAVQTLLGATTANVTAAGALMDSEVASLSGVKTLTIPDSVTITSFAATVLDDADAATARTTLGLGTAAVEDSNVFASASHTHTHTAITDFDEAVDDRVNTLLVGGTNTTLTYDDGANTLTIDVSSGTSTDSDAIHDNVAGEIALITEKTTPVSADLIIIEDSADSNNKKRVQVGNLPAAGISSGAGAPATTPSAVGDVYVDTTNDQAYIACGTASSADWKLATEIGQEASSLTTIAAVESADHLLVLDNSDSDGFKRIGLDELVTGLTEEGAPAAGDFLFGVEAGGAVRKFDVGDLPTGSGMSNFTAAGDSGGGQTITDGNTLTVAGGAGITTADSATDTVTINLDQEYRTEVVTVCLFDDSEDAATGDGAGDQLFRVPSTMNGWDLVGVAAYVQTAGTTGTTDVQIHNVTQAADMLSTVITIDSAETDSSTAATAAVIDTANDDVVTGDKIRFDVDAVSTTAPKGLWVELQFRAP